MENQTRYAPPPLPAPARPKSVTVFGILGIVFGALGLLCSPINLLNFSSRASPVSTLPGFKAFVVFGAINGLLCAVALLTLGIGLLNLKRWARAGSVIYAIYTLACGVLSMLLVILIIAPHLGGAHDHILRAGMIGGLIGGVLGGLLGLIYPIFLLVYMRKPHVVAACCK